MGRFILVFLKLLYLVLVTPVCLFVIFESWDDGLMHPLGIMSMFGLAVAISIAHEYNAWRKAPKPHR